MNIKRALRIAEEQPWFKSFTEYLDKYRDGGSNRYFKRDNWKELPPESFIIMAFPWGNSKEGISYWRDVYIEFAEKYKDTSIKVFVKEAGYDIPVARLIAGSNEDISKFIDTLRNSRISYDYISQERNSLIAYKKGTEEIKEEWI